MRFYCYSFLPTVLEAVLEAVMQKMNEVPYLNRGPLNIGYGFNAMIVSTPPLLIPDCLPRRIWYCI